MATEVSKIGRRGTVVIPARMRRRFRLDEGTLIIAEEREDGVLIRPAAAVPVEVYSPERVAEFLLSNTVDADDYARAEAEVRKLGLDPAAIDHERPT